MNIAISSIGSSPSVGLIKCIKKADENIKIIGFDINEYGYTAGSMLVDNFYKIPPYNHELFITKLLEIFQIEGVDMFIPIHDFEIKVVAENIEKFKDYKVIIPSIHNVNLFSNKYKSSIDMNKIRVQIPKILDENYTLKRIIRKNVSVGSRGIRILHSMEKVNIESDEFMQEYIDGEEYTVDICCDLEGNPVLIIPRIRLEVKAGVATKAKLVYETGLIEICKKILTKYKVPGLLNIQFIKKENQFYFIELNPRFGGSSISSVLGSYNYIYDFIKSNYGTFEENMNRVKWNSLITRYYEEVIYEP